MLNNEKTIRFEDFAAVSQDGGDVLGKVLYYSLSSILIDRDELESLCDAVGFPKGRSNRTAMGDAFRSATGDIYERRVVKTDSGPQIFKVYCRDNKGGNASVISRELVKETVHEDTNEYRKLANITFNKTSKLFSYDPRTKLAVLTTIAVFILGGSYEGVMQYYIIVLAAIPLLLLLSAGKWKGAVLYLLIFGGSLCLELFGLSYLTGVANFIAVAIVGLFLRFTPGIVMGYFVVTTTTVSEFVAAMERLHLPQQITIPMSVMFRFFPTVAEEWSAIGDAMRMRGVRFGGGKAGSILEYRMVPMMICSVKIGEELSAAALTRGLGGPVKRTNICKIWFRAQDIVLLLICLGAFAAQVYVWAARG